MAFGPPFIWRAVAKSEGKIMKLIKNFLTDDSGASAAEYALILAVVGAGIAGAALALGNAIDAEIDAATNLVEGAIT